jgi:hypothetical protein
MRKLWWMIRYSHVMKCRTLMGWRFCWDAAVNEIDNNTDWRDYTPAEAVASELSYWSD